MPGMRVKNDQGHELEFDDRSGRWVPVDGGQQQAAPKVDPADLLSPGSKFDRFGEAMAVSAGDQFSTMGRNMRDWYAAIRGDKDAQLRIEDERVEADKLRRGLHESSPVAATIGAMLPTAPLMLLSGGAAAATPMGIARTVGGQALSSAAQGALQSESGDYLEDAALSGGMSLGMSAAGQIIGRVQAGRAAMKEAAAAPGGAMGAQQAMNMTEGERDVLAGAKRAGLQLLPGQETANPQFRKMEAGMAANPFMSKFFDDVDQGNRQQLNRLAARAMGVEADNVGPAVRVAAEKAIGDKFDEVGQRLGKVDLDPLIQQVEGMAKAESLKGAPRMEIKGILHNLQAGQKNRLAELGAEEGRFISGPEMMEMRSTLSTKMRDAFNSGNSARGQLYADVLEKYDDAIGDAAAALAGRAGVPPAKAAREADQVMGLYQHARDQWNVWRALDRGGSTPDGHVQIAAAYNNMARGDKSGLLGRAGKDGESLLRTGTGTIGENATGDLYDALRFYNSRLGKPIVPNTGGTVGAFNQWMNSGGTIPALAKGGAGMLAMPAMKAYAGSSPLAAQAMFFTQQALRGQPTGGTGFALAQQAARTAQAGLGGLGGLGGF